MNFLLILFIFCGVFQIVYQLVLVTAIIKFKNNSQFSSEVSEHKSQISTSVSVVICAKNENENLQKHLPFILNQKYHDFEVIVVDDGSDEQFIMNDERLTIITLTKQEKIGLGKKYALRKGIEYASKDLILLTDADCKPASENWIAEMATSINTQHQIVLGVSPYYTENTFLNALVEYETAQTALQYLGFALLGNPYMAVGRNVCYSAALLKTKNWNKNELAIASGDDDLVIQTLATKDNITVCLKEDSYTYSAAKSNWESWFHQKTRHAESGFLYKLNHKLLLGIYIFTKNAFYITFLLLMIFSKMNVLFLLLFFFITIVLMSVINMVLNKKLSIQKRWFYTVILDPIYGMIPFLTGCKSLFQTNKKWK